MKRSNQLPPPKHKILKSTIDLIKAQELEHHQIRQAFGLGQKLALKV